MLFRDLSVVVVSTVRASVVVYCRVAIGAVHWKLYLGMKDL